MTQISRKGFVDKNGQRTVITPNVPGATAGNIASFNANGDVQDSGYKPGNFAASNHTHSGYAASLHSHPNIVNQGNSVYVDERGFIILVGQGALISPSNIANLNRALENPDNWPESGSDKLITSGAVEEKFNESVGDGVIYLNRGDRGNILPLPSVKIGNTYYSLDYCPQTDPNSPAYAGESYQFDRHAMFLLKPLNRNYDDLEVGGYGAMLCGSGTLYYTNITDDGQDIDTSTYLVRSGYTDEIQKPGESGVSHYLIEGIPSIKRMSGVKRYLLCTGVRNYTNNGLDITVYFYEAVDHDSIDKRKVTFHLNELYAKIMNLEPRVTSPIYWKIDETKKQNHQDYLAWISPAGDDMRDYVLPLLNDLQVSYFDMVESIVKNTKTKREVLIVDSISSNEILERYTAEVQYLGCSLQEPSGSTIQGRLSFVFVIGNLRYRFNIPVVYNNNTHVMTSATGNDVISITSRISQEFIP